MRWCLLASLFLLTPTLQALEGPPPEGFIEQILEPTGGRIFRPKDWHYSEEHRANAFQWTISKEDTHGGKGRYETGVRIQLLAKIKEKTGHTPQEFLMAFMNKKRENAEHIHRIEGPETEGMFTRYCLEVDEGKYRIHYSVYWPSPTTDLGTLFIAGAPKELWDEYEHAFDTMHSMELIDMSRFTDDKNGGEPVTDETP